MFQKLKKVGSSKTLEVDQNFKRGVNDEPETTVPME